jgi:hypothetical protein
MNLPEGRAPPSGAVPAERLSWQRYTDQWKTSEVHAIALRGDGVLR